MRAEIIGSPAFVQGKTVGPAYSGTKEIRRIGSDLPDRRVSLATSSALSVPGASYLKS